MRRAGGRGAEETIGTAISDPARPMSGFSLGRPTILLLFGRAAAYPLSLLNAVILARALGVEGLGAYAYAMGMAALFGLLPNMGISMLLTRTIAQDPEAGAGMMSASIRAQAVLAVGVLILVPAVATVLPERPIPTWCVGLAAAQLALGTLSWPYLAILGGRARYDRLAIAEMAAAVVGSASVVAAAAFGGGVAAFLVAHVLAAGLAVLIARRVARPFAPSTGRTSIGLRSLFRQAAPLGAGSAVQSLYTRLDLVLLGQMAAPAALGLYSAAYKPINVAVFFGNTVAGVLLPVMAQPAQRDVPLAFQRAVRALWAVGPAMALALTGLASPVLRLLFGAAYAPAAPLLAILAWSAAANWLYAPFAISLQARNRERPWLWCLILAALLNAGGNAWAIPRWGALGAAGVTLASEGFLLALATLLAWRLLGIALPVRLIAGCLAGAAGGGLALAACRGLGPIASTAAALAVHTGLLVGCRSVSGNDLAILLGWVKEAILVRSRG
jgi:O-antigen/teichoic acid export membrane protein